MPIGEGELIKVGLPTSIAFCKAKICEKSSKIHQKVMEQLASEVQQASYQLQQLDTDGKNSILLQIHAEMKSRKDEILKQNQLDLTSQKDQITPQLFKRLDISKKFDSLLQGILDVASLKDPANKVQLATQLDKGLELFKVSCPIGTLLIIFEARPEVVVQISCLAIKSGNAVILKGGKEAWNSNLVLYEIIQNAISKIDIKLKNAVRLVIDRREISELLKLDRYIDLVIPRGSNQLVKFVSENTRIPVLGHADGICSVYVDESADLKKSVEIVTDGKTNYPAACNTTETLLIHSKVLNTHLVAIHKSLISKGVTMKVDERAFKVIGDLGGVEVAIEEDFRSEFLDLIIAVKTVDSLQEAIDHINSHGSHHTDCICTETKTSGQAFMKQVDSAGVFLNASTRFADGFRYGFGAEIGVSTAKTHARGPVGLEGLMIYKYRLYGEGNFVGEYSNGKQFSHVDLGLEYGQSKIDKDL
jgi:glutamate-5-semialdehyde dehydrogenase